METGTSTDRLLSLLVCTGPDPYQFRESRPGSDESE